MPDVESKTPTVHLLCGLVGAGKTTYANHLAATLPAVRFTLDQWMLTLHGLPYDAPEYGAKAARCKEVIWRTALDVLALGDDVVLDWNLWSRDMRADWRRRAEAAGYVVRLHYVDVPLPTAVSRASKRARSRAPGAYVIDEQGVRHSAALLEPPTETEGIEITRVDDADLSRVVSLPEA